MADKEKRLVILGKGGGSGTQVQSNWNENDTTSPAYIQNKPTIPTATSDLTNDSGFRSVIELTDMTQAELLDFYTNYATLVETNTYTIEGYSFSVLEYTTQGIPVKVLQYNIHAADEYVDGVDANTLDIKVKVAYLLPDGTLNMGQHVMTYSLPRVEYVKNSTITIEDSEGTTIDSFTLNQSSDKTITLPAGGGSGNVWYGSQAEFNAIPEPDEDTDYYISEIDYSEISNTPDLSSYATKTEMNAANDEQNTEIASKMNGLFLTQQEFDDLAVKKEGENYFIEGTTVQMVVTFTDQTTATYNVVVD